MEDSFEKWTIVGGEAGNELRSPTIKIHFIDSFEALNKAKVLNPTDKSVIDRMNELGELLNDLSKRRFYGNITLAIIAFIFPVFLYFIQRNNLDYKNIGGIIIMCLPAIAYILSNFAPTYIVARRNNSYSGLFGGIIAAIIGVGAATAATQHYNELTWSDGSKTVESDLGSNVGSLGFGLVLIIVAILLSIVLVTVAATIAFFRNYVFFK